MTCDTNYKMKSVLLLKLLRQRFHPKQPKIHDVLYVAEIRTQDPRWAWQTRDALDLMSNYFVDLTFLFFDELFWQIIFQLKEKFCTSLPSEGWSSTDGPTDGKFCQNVDVALALKEVQIDVEIFLSISMGGVGGCAPIEIAISFVLSGIWLIYILGCKEHIFNNLASTGVLSYCIFN